MCIRDRPYSSVVVKKETPTPSVSMTGVKTEEPKGNIIKPEWDSKKVVTEGVKTVQECQDPRGCPQDVSTGECLEGCSEQKVKIEMTETIIDPEIIDENTATYKPENNDLSLNLLLHTDPFNGALKQSWPSHYGTVSYTHLTLPTSDLV